MSDTNNANQTNPSATSLAWLYSVLGVIVLFALLVAVNFIVKRALPAKIDLTEDKLYTLGDGTRELLEGLDTKVKLTFFASEDEDNIDPRYGFKEYKPTVNALLDTYRRTAKPGMIEVVRLNPEPDSKAAEQAIDSKIEPIPGRMGGEEDPVYFGLSVNCLDRTSAIPVLLPARERLLEYEISRAILEVTRSTAPKVGYMSPFEIAGTPPMRFPGAPPAMPQWNLHRTLERDFDPDPSEEGSNFVRLEMDLEKVPDDIDTLLLIHPAGISAKTEYAIDQFVMRGGNVVAFLDAFSVWAHETRPQPQQPGMPAAPGTPVSSDLPTLLPAWGVDFEDSLVVSDTSHRWLDIRTFRENTSFLRLTSEAIDDSDAATNGIRDVLVPMAGAFYLDEEQGVESKVLMHTSSEAELVEPMLANAGGRGSDGGETKEYPLAVRLTGKFSSAFPDGKPAADGGDEGDAADGGDDDEGETAGDPAHLAAANAESSIVLVADSDCLFNAFLQTVDSYRRAFTNHNLPFAQNVVELASGGATLAKIRSRGSVNRPFTKFKEMEKEAGEEIEKEMAKVDEEIENLREEQQGYAQELSEILTKAFSEQRGSAEIVVEMSPELQAKQKAAEAAEERLEAQIDESRKKRAKLGRELRQKIRGIENGIKLKNMLIVPLIVILIGIAHLVIRKRSLSAH